MRVTATVTSKGQVTLPKAIRERLGGRIIEFVAEGSRIEIRPVPDVAGSLAEYADSYVPLDKAREAVWGGRG